MSGIPNGPASHIVQVEGVLLSTLVVAYVLWFMIRLFRRSRADFRVGGPLAVGLGLRLVAIAGVGSLGLSTTLRGGDELTFLSRAQFLAAGPLSSQDLPHGPFQLHTILFDMELRLGFLNQTSMRIIQVGIAMLGLLFMVAAVHDLGGARSARLTAWLLAIEPTAIFFNSALHKEPNMELAAGLVVFGGTMLWRRLDVRGIFLCALGGLIAVETRSYAGWFLVSAAVLVLLHAAIRGMHRPMRAMPAIYAVVIIGVIATPTILQASSKKNLQSLQQSQNANANSVGTGTSGANSNNLALEQVNFSTRGAILSNLPQRMRDVLLRPWPWQLGDTSQRVGAVGTLIAYAVLLLLIRYMWMSRGRVFKLTGPLLYPALFLLIAYSLSAGNAGTGFRYRSHLLTLGIAAVVILRERSATSCADRRVAACERERARVNGAIAAPV